MNINNARMASRLKKLKMQYTYLYIKDEKPYLHLIVFRKKSIKLITHLLFLKLLANKK